MAKKHRLKINYSEITEDNFDIVQSIRDQGVDGEVCEINGDILIFKNVDIVMLNQGRQWLTEINEPLTRKESWCSYSARNKSVDEISPEALYGSGWEACLKNQKLGQVVDEKNDYQEFLNFVKEHSTYSDIDTWKAALKHARGL